MKHSLTGKVGARPQIAELVINWHITEACNYRCRYCYAHWDGDGRELIHDILNSTRMLEDIWQYFHPANAANPLRQHMDWQGIRLNLAGGEPLLYAERVCEIVRTARDIGFTTSLITNGSLLLPAMTRALAPHLSLLGVSLDSSKAPTNHLIGRHGRHGQQLMLEELEDAISEAKRCNPGLPIKLNTVVSSLNCHEDMADIVQRLAPVRWKVLRMLPVVTRELMVSDTDFQCFVARHRHLGPILCVEDNSEMVESYVMIDPLGRFFQNSFGQSSYRYSHPILEVGVEQAFSKVGMDPAKFCARYITSALESAG